MGLIAREIEAAGVPTLVLSSAWDITAAVRPPRAVFVHHPLGNTLGAPGDAEGQRAVTRAALERAATLTRAEIAALPFRWSAAPGWEARAYAPGHTPTGPDGKPVRDAAPG